MLKTGENAHFDSSWVLELIFNSINRFSEFENHRKDILQGMDREIILSGPIFANFDLAAILDFRHFEFSKMVDDVINERIDLKNPTNNTIAYTYER